MTVGAIPGSVSWGDAERARLVRLLTTLVPCPCEAEDLAHEALLRAFEARERFDGTRPAWPWLATIARNLVRDRHRRHALLRRLPLEPLAETLGGEDPPPAAFEAEERAVRIAALKAALRSLPPCERATFAHFYERGLPIAAVAEAMGAPAGTVKSWLHRARERLRAALAPLLAEDAR